ncbi:unnamed protein product [Adineta steineri]|uniref:RING-type E3 ubiquitin transferase n=1 Tax=Adineta steineri TaxID=433720 RepID=A0A814N5R3_9BILA|nr:unnamed protein product [Adineta steineri]CAF3573506.1 unnamed protein product [Adineta steineri]
MDSNEASICPLCRHEKVKIFAVGECSHPVCHLCSTKMRILCEQTYCAICRQELPKVYFVSDLADTQPTIDPSRFTPIDETGDCGIYYPIKADWIRRETEKLLRNFCPFCHSEFETFEILRDHVRRTHRYFYCDLCVEHLDLFPHERKCYTRHDLVQHTRCGDRDDTSFKGHPLCRFCDDHFLDVDQLYKHMRKEHYYCHICTTDSVYYSDFDLLREHYRSTHYLCEIDQCKDVQFTNVFASETDFRAHQAAQHSKNRAHARQLGAIAVEFQSSSTRDRKQPHEPAHRGVFRSGEFNTQGNTNSSRNERDDTQPAVAAAVPTIDEFPTLGERSSTPQNVPQQRGAWVNDSSRGIHSTTEFPALTGAAANIPNTNTRQPGGIWREQQQQQQTAPSASINQNKTSKKVPSSAKPVTNGVLKISTAEDFPTLRGASNTKIPAPVSMFSAWATAKKTAKTTNASAKGNQPQMRMNTNRLMIDDEDEEYIRRPMTSLTTSSTPMAASNITLISSTDLSANETERQNKNQSVPKAQDFPALPSTAITKNNKGPSGVWTNDAAKSPSTQQKKKNNGMSKKKFIEEIQSMQTPPSLNSTNDFPAMGLNELGRRLITDDDEPTKNVKVKQEKTSSQSQASSTKQVKEEKMSSRPQSSSVKQVKEEKIPSRPQSTPIQQVKEEKKPSPPQASAKKPVKDEKTPSPPPPPQASSVKQEKKEEKISPVQSNKKEQKVTKPNDSVKQETSSTKDVTPAKSINNQASSQPLVQNETVVQSAQPVTSSLAAPPGFTPLLSVAPPPGFNLIPPSQPTPPPPSYIVTSSHAKQKNEFRAKLFDLFDGDMNLFVEYDKFCNAFAQKEITSDDFIKYTKQLFKDKIDEYLLEFIIIIPNIEQQNELYTIWKNDIHPSSTVMNTNNWTQKKFDENNIHICRICKQILLETDIDEHNSNHPEFNTQFPSLPAAALPIGRATGKKKK